MMLVPSFFLFASLVLAAPAINTPSGYSLEASLDNAAINAPSDCNGISTYLGVKSFPIGPFNIDLCATSCTEQSAYNLRHPPALPARAKTCQFFNTYILYKNGVSTGQVIM